VGAAANCGAGDAATPDIGGPGLRGLRHGRAAGYRGLVLRPATRHVVAAARGLPPHANPGRR